ncbi:MAG TPA: NAD(P)-dependent oxidoreductase, partial [Candidatus Saccharimonadales bacterium]
NYLKAGYEVMVWNRSPEKTKPLEALGASQASTPKIAAQNADIVFEVTANDASSRDVWQGPEGILAGANAGTILITSATLSIDWTLQLAKLCADADFTFFDIPLTGGRVAAENGSLSLLVGGDETKLAELQPDLTAISAKVFYFGPIGAGMKYKLVLNSLQAAHIAAFGEAMELAATQGLDPAKVGPALCERPGGVVTDLAWTAYQQARPPLTFSVDWITKDLEYAKQMRSGNDLPVFDDVLALYQAARKAGHGPEDWTSILKD